MQCTKCKHIFVIKADLEQRNEFPEVARCPNTKECTEVGAKHFRLVDDSSVCKDFQDVKLQERVENVGVGAIPRSVLAILQDDLVDKLQAGDNVELLGKCVSCTEFISLLLRDSVASVATTKSRPEARRGDVHTCK